jgi:hypothetical protein
MPLSLYQQGSGNYGAQAEYDLLSRNNGLNTGRYGNGFGGTPSSYDFWEPRRVAACDQFPASRLIAAAAVKLWSGCSLLQSLHELHRRASRQPY